MPIMRLSIFAHHIGELALNEAPAKFALTPCEGLRFEVEIQPAEHLSGQVWDTVIINGVNMGNRHGGIDNFTRQVMEANPTIVMD